MSDYPTKQQLNKIVNWKISSREDILDYFNYIKLLWYRSNSGYNLTGKKTIKLILHTFGWSGNEDIILSMQKNVSWIYAWQGSWRGGHYFLNLRGL